MMEVLSGTDPRAEPYTQKFKNLKDPYWLFVKNALNIGILITATEPRWFLARPGTKVAALQLLNPESPDSDIREFATKAVQVAEQQGVLYASIGLFSQHEQKLQLFREAGFKDFDDCYRMACQLDAIYQPSGLALKRLERVELPEFLSKARSILEGSPDVTIIKAMQFFSEMPDTFLDSVYAQEELYYAQKDGSTIGVLDINTSTGLVALVGVDPSERGKGYGRQIMLFALDLFQKRGCKQSYLRVHVNNTAAIHLYENLGYRITDRYKNLLWQRTT